MTDVNDRTRERYEPEWDGGGAPPPTPRHRHRRSFALRLAAGALGAGAAVWGVWALWGAPAAAILGGLVLLRVARPRHRHHHGGRRGPQTASHRSFYFRCCSPFFGPPFRQKIV